MDLPEPVVLAKVDDGNEDNRQRLRAGCARPPALLDPSAPSAARLTALLRARSAEDMYNYSSYPSLLLFRGNSEPTNRCPYDEDCPPVKEGCPHPGDRKGLDCWEFYSGGREQEDITFWMSTISKGLNPYDEEAKLKPGLYKDNHGPVTATPHSATQVPVPCAGA